MFSSDALILVKNNQENKMNFLNSICSCFKPAISYSAVKKDDDQGIEQLNQWLNANPVQKNLHALENKKIQGLAKQAIGGLKLVPLTSTNFPIIRGRLMELAMESSELKSALITEISKEKLSDKSIKKMICNSLIIMSTSKA